MFSKSYQCVLIYLFSFYVGIESQSCVTPNDESGLCVSLYDCSILLSAFQKRPIPPSTLSFLRRSQCGFEGNIPRVCCGQTGPPAETSSSESTQPSRPVINVPSGVEPSHREDSLPSPSSECGYDSTNRIYGGQITDLDEFPWMALLGYKRGDGSISYQCGGVLINRRYVLTAAHCVTGAIETAVGKLASVRLGEYNIETDIDCVEFKKKKSVCADPTQEIAVHKAYPHAGFSDKNINRRDDLALVRLAQRVNYTTYIQPICVADSSARTTNDENVFVAGWGKTLSGSNSNVKLKLAVPIYDKQQCDIKFRTVNAFLTNKQVCAGGVFKEDTCRGDSGGPLMRRRNDGDWESIGIVSFGKGCGGDDWPGVYTSVPSYNDWILQTLQTSNQ